MIGVIILTMLWITQCCGPGRRAIFDPGNDVDSYVAPADTHAFVDMCNLPVGKAAILAQLAHSARQLTKLNPPRNVRRQTFDFPI